LERYGERASERASERERKRERVASLHQPETRNPHHLAEGGGGGDGDAGLVVGLDQLLHINVQRFRGGLVFKAHRLCVSLNSWLESNKEEDHLAERGGGGDGDAGLVVGLHKLPPLRPPLLTLVEVEPCVRTTVNHLTTGVSKLSLQQLTS